MDFKNKNWLILIGFRNRPNQILISWSDFESDRNWHSNLDGLKSESCTIRFVDPNCLSLLFKVGAHNPQCATFLCVLHWIIFISKQAKKCCMEEHLVLDHINIHTYNLHWTLGTNNLHPICETSCNEAFYIKGWV